MYFYELNKNTYNNKYLQRVYNKYDGKNHMKWEIVQNNIPEEVLEFIEDIWIGAGKGRKEDKKYGLNMRDASRPRFGKEIIDKIIKSNKGRIPPNKGKKASLETIEKIKQKRSLQTISHSQKTKDKIGNANRGKKRTQEQLENDYEKIVQLDLNSNYIKTWNTCKEASITLNISRGNISSVITGNRNSSGGFKWIKEKNFKK
jgi:hypothetical protein